MTLVRYNPLANFVPGTFGDLIESALRDTNHATFLPQADIIKTDKNVELHLIAPGMSKEDFVIDLSNDILKISGERKTLNDEGVTYVKRESKYGSFERTFTLSEDINTDGIDAKYENGILKITLPLIEKKENKSVIKVK